MHHTGINMYNTEYDDMYIRKRIPLGKYLIIYIYYSLECNNQRMSFHHKIGLARNINNQNTNVARTMIIIVILNIFPELYVTYDIT